MKGLTGTRVLAAVVVLAVVAVVATGIVLIGPPGEERGRRLDQRRVNDLTSIGYAVTRYWQTNKRLPESIEEMARESGIADPFSRDPISGEPYSYRQFDSTSYELCATFNAASASGTGGDPWSHGAGRRCFRRTLADPRNVP